MAYLMVAETLSVCQKVLLMAVVIMMGIVKAHLMVLVMESQLVFVMVFETT